MREDAARTVTSRIRAALPDERPASPETRLLWAILFRAVADANGDFIFIDGRPASGWVAPADRRSARRWFQSRSQLEFTWLWVAAQLGFDASYRQKIEIAVRAVEPVHFITTSAATGSFFRH